MRPSASRALLLTQCAHWLTIDAPDEPPSEAMSLGTDVHRMIEVHIARKGPISQNSEAERLYRAWVRDISATIPTMARAEVSFAWVSASDNGAEIGRSLNRDYGEHPSGVLVGTADCVWMQGSEVVVTDWKASSGFGEDRSEQYRAQLRALALMAARAYAADGAVTRIVHIRESGCEVVEERLDSLELDAIASELRAALTASTEPRAGSHCTGCPARAACPETSRAMTAATAWSIDTPEQIAAVWPKLAVVLRVADELKARIKATVESGGDIPLTNGKRLRIVESKGRESVSVASVDAALGPEGAARWRAEGVIKRGPPTHSLKET